MTLKQDGGCYSYVTVVDLRRASYINMIFVSDRRDYSQSSEQQSQVGIRTKGSGVGR